MQGGEGEKFAFNFKAASGEAEAEPQAEGVVEGEEEQLPAGEGEEEQQEGYEEEEQYDEEEEEEYVAPAEEVQFSRSVRVRASIQHEPRFPTHASCIIGMWVC